MTRYGWNTANEEATFLLSKCHSGAGGGKRRTDYARVLGQGGRLMGRNFLLAFPTHLNAISLHTPPGFPGQPLVLLRTGRQQTALGVISNMVLLGCQYFF